MTTALDLREITNGDLLHLPVVAHLATIRPDGHPQSNPVWFQWDGTYLKVSQTTDRKKLHNMEGNPRVALSNTDPSNPYRYLEVRGLVDRVDDDPDRIFIDHLSQVYMGQTPYPNHQRGDKRVVVLIRPTATSGMA